MATCKDPPLSTSRSATHAYGPSLGPNDRLHPILIPPHRSTPSLRPQVLPLCSPSAYIHCDHGSSTASYRPGRTPVISTCPLYWFTMPLAGIFIRTEHSLCYGAPAPIICTWLEHVGLHFASLCDTFFPTCDTPIKGTFPVDVGRLEDMSSRTGWIFYSLCVALRNPKPGGLRLIPRSAGGAWTVGRDLRADRTPLFMNLSVEEATSDELPLWQDAPVKPTPH